jgi:hypothetical protein
MVSHPNREGNDVRVDLAFTRRSNLPTQLGSGGASDAPALGSLHVVGITRFIRCSPLLVVGRGRGWLIWTGSAIQRHRFRRRACGGGGGVFVQLNPRFQQRRQSAEHVQRPLLVWRAAVRHGGAFQGIGYDARDAFQAHGRIIPAPALAARNHSWREFLGTPTHSGQRHGDFESPDGGDWQERGCVPVLDKRPAEAEVDQNELTESAAGRDWRSAR